MCMHFTTKVMKLIFLLSYQSSIYKYAVRDILHINQNALISYCGICVLCTQYSIIVVRMRGLSPFC